MNRTFYINLTANATAFLISFGISFLLTPFIVKNVGSDAYGFVGLTNNLISYMQLFTIALNSMAGRYITIKIHEKNYKSANKYFNSILISNIIMSIFISILSICLILNIEKIIEIPPNIILDVKFLFILMMINLIISIISSTFAVSTFATNKLSIQYKINVKANITKAVILVALFLIFKPSIVFIGIATTLSTLYLLIENIRCCKVLLPNIVISKKYYDKRYIKEVVYSGIWNSVAKLSQILGTGLDLFFANIFIGSNEMGILAIAKTVPDFIQGFIGNIVSIFAPINTFLYAEGKLEELADNLKRSVKIMGIISSIPIAGLFVLGKDFYELWVPGNDSAVLFVLSSITIIGFAFSASLEPLYNIFIVTNKLKLNTIVLFISSFLSTITVIFLLKNTELGIYCIAGVSCFYETIRITTFLPIYSASILKVSKFYFYKPLILNLVSIILTTIFGMIVKKVIIVDTWLSLILVAGIITIIALVLNIILIFDRKEKKYFKYKVLKIIKEKINERNT